MFMNIKLSIKAKRVKKWEIISCPQTYIVLFDTDFSKCGKVYTLWALLRCDNAHNCLGTELNSEFEDYQSLILTQYYTVVYLKDL